MLNYFYRRFRIAEKIPLVRTARFVPSVFTGIPITAAANLVLALTPIKGFPALASSGRNKSQSVIANLVGTGKIK